MNKLYSRHYKVEKDEPCECILETLASFIACTLLAVVLIAIFTMV